MQRPTVADINIIPYIRVSAISRFKFFTLEESLLNFDFEWRLRNEAGSGYLRSTHLHQLPFVLEA